MAVTRDHNTEIVASANLGTLTHTRSLLTMLFRLLATLSLLSTVAALHAGPLAPTRGRAPGMLVAPTKAEKLVRRRLNPQEDIKTMNEKEVRRYAYAMQIEVQRLIREEQRLLRMELKIRDLVAEMEGDEDQPEGLTQDEFAALIPAMKMEGFVRYGLAYATVNTKWDRVRKNTPVLANRSDAELYEAFKATGKGITSVYGDLW